MRARYLYVATTKDKYELPVAVADSARELADMMGMELITVYSYLRGDRVNQRNNFYKIPWDEPEE